MAKQKGIISIIGTLGGINFYMRKGVALARKAGGGFNSKSIKTNPNMVRVRENSNEFGMCSKVKSVFRMALGVFLEDFKDGTLHGRMMQLFQEIKSFDTVSSRGERRVALGMHTAIGKQRLMAFRINPNRTAENTLLCSSAFNWANFSYRIRDFDVKTLLFPRGATHLEVRLALLRFDFNALEYDITMSDSQWISRDFEDSNFSLSPSEIPTGVGEQIAVVKVRFYQEVSGVMYPLKASEDIGFSIVGVNPSANGSSS